MTESYDEMVRIIEENVNKSGYPLELHLHSYLASNHYWPSSNDYFYDPDGKTARSLDLVADLAYYAKGPPFVHFEAKMAIECKKNDSNAWVFFSVDEDYVFSSHAGQIIDHKKILLGGYDYQSVLWDIDNKLRLHYGKEDDNVEGDHISISYKVVRKGKESGESKDDIFEAINQVLKYVSYNYEKNRLTFLRKAEHGTTLPFVEIYFPVIVFQGDLFEGQYSSGKIKLKPTNHVILKYLFQPSYSESPLEYYIDIVKKEYFETFFKLIESERNMLMKFIEAKKEDLIDNLDSYLEENNKPARNP